MKGKRDNALIGAILLAFSAGYGYMITQLPTREMANTLGIDFMPWIYCILLASLSILLVIGALRDSIGQTGAPTTSLAAKDIIGTVVLFGFFAVYILLIDLIGFLIVTPLFIFGMMLLEGVRSYANMVIVAVVATLAIYVLFRFIFEVSITGIAFL